jgi:hypothetical protein
MILLQSPTRKFIFERVPVSTYKGPAVAKGLAEIILRKPTDPVEFLAHYLYKYAEIKDYEQKVRR